MLYNITKIKKGDSIMSKFCSTCGCEVADDETICPICNSTFPAVTPAAQPVETKKVDPVQSFVPDQDRVQPQQPQQVQQPQQAPVQQAPTQQPQQPQQAPVQQAPAQQAPQAVPNGPLVMSIIGLIFPILVFSLIGFIGGLKIKARSGKKIAAIIIGALGLFETLIVIIEIFVMSGLISKLG